MKGPRRWNQARHIHETCLRNLQNFRLPQTRPALEEVPEELVIHFVVVLDFGRLYECS